MRVVITFCLLLVLAAAIWLAWVLGAQGAQARGDRARVRLACTNAIQGAAEVADFAYKGAGVDAIFPGSPFERRFRDMHTLSQQIQARTAHFEQVGRILLGVPPEEFL